MLASPASTPLFAPHQRAFAETLVELAFANPFVSGFAVVGGAPVATDYLQGELAELTHLLRERLAAGAAASPADLVLYKELALLYLYSRYAEKLDGGIEQEPQTIEFYDDLAGEHAFLHDFPGGPPEPSPPARLIECAFQIRRALHFIRANLVGGSPPAARLRTQVWESIFTHDLRRYLRTMYARMDEIPTLILGASGSGKEVVARTIGLSRHIPFDADERCFVADHARSFHALNLSALAPTVIESELFGHRRGSFTGAVADKQGWLELGGTLFLDEIGEIGGDVQVKLLRVIQERCFQRVGDVEDHPLRGKIIAATHRDLVARMNEGTFRLDLYMRISADCIRTPSLREILDAAPGERRNLVRHIAARVAGPAEADQLTGEVEAWIEANLPPDYAWPGNMRELENWVRTRLVHHSSPPVALAPAPGEEEEEGEVDSDEDEAVEVEDEDEVDDEEDDFVRAFRNGELTADQVVGRLATIVHAQTGSYRETARRLGVDRRTVTQSVDRAMLARLVKRRGGDGEP